jgi:hypothetical protein
MPHEREEHDDEVAAGAICRVPDCGALVIAFRATSVARPDRTDLWAFACFRCGAEFDVPEGELVFHSVPKDWLLAGFISRKPAPDDPTEMARPSFAN